MKFKRILAPALASTMLLSLCSGCKKDEPDKIDTMKRTNGQAAVFELANYDTSVSEDELKYSYSTFIFNLLSQSACGSDENILISPDSIFFCLDQVAAGANGDTLDQIMQMTTPGVDQGAALQFAADRMDHLQCKQLNIANSVWINELDGSAVYRDYLSFVKNNFHSEVSFLKMDAKASDTINSWVNNQTDGMIPSIVDSLSPDTALLLINAICFEDKWAQDYEADDVYSDVFFASNLQEQQVMFLHSEEETYLYNNTAQGFIKPYKNNNLGYMVILPNDPDIQINDYLGNMTADEYWTFWNNQTATTVYTAFPEYTCEYETSMTPYLQNMGMIDAFQPSANFSNMIDSPVCISDVIHKTYISVDQSGTKAAAATNAIATHSLTIDLNVSQYVICDRPFAYAIVDMETGLPVFIGTVNSVTSPA